MDIIDVVLGGKRGCSGSGLASPFPTIKSVVDLGDSADLAHGNQYALSGEYAAELATKSGAFFSKFKVSMDETSDFVATVFMQPFDYTGYGSGWSGSFSTPKDASIYTISMMQMNGIGMAQLFVNE